MLNNKKIGAASSAVFSSRNVGAVSKKCVSAVLLSAAVCSGVTMSMPSLVMSATDPGVAAAMLSGAKNAAGSIFNMHNIWMSSMVANSFGGLYSTYVMHIKPYLTKFKPKVNPLKGITREKMKSRFSLLEKGVVGQEGLKKGQKSSY